MWKNVLGILSLILLLSGQSFAQAGFEKWDERYSLINLAELLDSEQHYADSIEAISGKEAHYFRAGKYRFAATYLGLKRRLDAKVMKSMQYVLGRTVGDPGQLEELLEHEYLFQAGDVRFWAPMQRQLEAPFAEEVRNGDTVLLYCLFLNEHSGSGLYNTFLVSEFLKK
ncbi:hypothetical protein OB13_02065 [Pontibacter sp. HJ8]